MPSSTRRAKRPVSEVLAEHDLYIDSLVGGFQRELQGVVASAQARTLAELQKRLTVTDGVVERTPANQRVLRQIDNYFKSAMDRAGYGQLAEEFVQGFNGSLPYFDEILTAISDNLKTPLDVTFGKADLAYFTSQQITTVESLGAVVDGVASSAKRKALMSVGALSFGDLADEIATTFHRGVGEAATLAETSMTMFFRTVTSRGFEKIEDGLPEGAVRYRYEGPRDKLTRPFCLRMLRLDKPITREEIEGLDNGQIPNPFISGGGYNCRHQWVITEIRDGK